MNRSSVASLEIASLGLLKQDLRLAQAQVFLNAVERHGVAEARSEIVVAWIKTHAGNINGWVAAQAVGDEQVEVAERVVARDIDAAGVVVDEVALRLQVEAKAEGKVERLAHVDLGHRQLELGRVDRHRILDRHAEAGLEAIDAQAIGLALRTQAVEGEERVLDGEVGLKRLGPAAFNKRPGARLDGGAALDLAFTVGDALKLQHQQQVIAGEFVVEIAAKLLKVAGGVDQVAARLDQRLLRDFARTAEKRNVCL